MDLTSYRRCFRLAWLGVLCPLVATAADDPVAKVEKAATEWVKTRAETVRAETEWSGQRGLMEALVAALDERAKLVEEKMEHEKSRTAQEREELDGLAAKNAQAGTALQDSEARLKAMGKALAELRPMLPPRLSAGLDLAFKSLADEKLSVGDRMQHTMAVLNRCAQFNRTISCNEEVLAIEGEPAPKSLDVIYWGLSHGYALDRAAAKAWSGSPGPQGWRWTPRPDAAAGIARLVAIATDKADPEFVVAPATLDHSSR